MSPSALSRMIGRLEEETGCSLFNRENRDISLTESGKRFVEYARKAVEDQNDILRELSSAPDLVSGTLHVYASVTACYTIMPPFIKLLAQKYPQIQLAVETGDPAGALGAVREGRAELAVGTIPDQNDGEIDSVSVRTSPLIFAAANNSSYRHLSGSPQDIVSTVPLILPKTGLARDRFDRWVKSRNVQPKIVAETEGNEAVMAIAALGLGIGLVPKIVLENGPYKAGFTVHEAGNALGFYNIGFLQKMELSGPEQVRKIRLAVSDILHGTHW